MEARILGALRRCAALDGLADFGGERAIFSRSAPDDVEFAGPGYPRCVFDWCEEYAPSRGRLTVWLAALDESAAAPDDMAARLADELDGMAFGGDRARVLRWRDTDGYEPGLEDMRAPRLSCAVVRFDAYEFRRAGEGVESALERAVGAALGAEFRTVYDAAAEGEAGDGRLYCLRLSALMSGKATAGCAWRSFEAALHLPCGDERAAQAAYAALADWLCVSCCADVCCVTCVLPSCEAPLWTLVCWEAEAWFLAYDVLALLLARTPPVGLAGRGPLGLPD